jgi:glycosyltransferase involved in cell wall biosynthesis
MNPRPFTWVSPYHPDDYRGGWKAMQHHLLRALEAGVGEARRIAPIDVPEEFFGKWISRAQKKLRMPRRYACYSESRLQAFADSVSPRLAPASVPVVFFGPLPFVKCRPTAPYFIYTDGAFFIHYWEYNQDHSHARHDIDRICAAEAEFMRRSAGVWCSSQWVADRITQEYQLPVGLAHCVGTGPGNVPPPIQPLGYENFVVMIAADFERKQGRLAVESVAAARKLGADVSIKFIGAKPPPDLLVLPFVEWCGWLDLKREADRVRYAELLSRAGAQILLSRTDLTPLVIPEAAIYSKATLATAVGGIPEMIQDGKTGWLVPPQATAAQIGALLGEIFCRPESLKATGQVAAAYCRASWSWTIVGEICAQKIMAVAAIV